MRFVFSRLFFVLLAFGFLPLSLSWGFPVLRYAVLIYDVALISLALVDYYISRNLQDDSTTACIRIPATEIEAVVRNRVATLFDDGIALIAVTHSLVDGGESSVLPGRVGAVSHD